MAVQRAAARAVAAVVRRADLENRYGRGGGVDEEERALPGCLLVARSASGEVVGAAGMEGAVWSRAANRVLPIAEGRALVRGGAALPDGHETSALVDNVAVKAALRRSGLAQELCGARLDPIAATWRLGTPTLLMQVPQGNDAARWLGAKLGFREGFRTGGTAAAGDDDACAEPPLITLGKRIGPVTWRLCAPVPP